MHIFSSLLEVSFLKNMGNCKKKVTSNIPAESRILIYYSEVLLQYYQAIAIGFNLSPDICCAHRAPSRSYIHPASRCILSILLANVDKSLWLAGIDIGGPWEHEALRRVVFWSGCIRTEAGGCESQW